MATEESQRSKVNSIRSNPTAIYNGNPFDKPDENRPQSPPARGTISFGSPRAISSVSSPYHRKPPFHEPPPSPRRKPSDFDVAIKTVKGPERVRMNRAAEARQWKNTDSKSIGGSTGSMSEDTPVVTGKSTGKSDSYFATYSGLHANVLSLYLTLDYFASFYAIYYSYRCSGQETVHFFTRFEFTNGLK